MRRIMIARQPIVLERVMTICLIAIMCSATATAIALYGIQNKRDFAWLTGTVVGIIAFNAFKDQ